MVCIFTIYCPTPYFLEAPGPSYVARNLVHVKGRPQRPTQGKFLLLTVVSEPASVLYCIYSLFEPAAQLTLKATGTPQAQSGGDEDAWQMSLSQSLAVENAFDTIVSSNSTKLIRGLSVAALYEKGPNVGKLLPEDIMQSLDGIPVRTMGDVGRSLSSHQPGQIVKAVVLRNGKPLRLDLTVWARGRRKIYGVVFAPILLDKTEAISVDIESEKVSGASGGLVFCLEILEQILPEDLIRGRAIAVTGTLDRRGRVGPIEGIRFKRIAAQRAGAQLFLCPADNLAELKGDNSATIPTVGVSTLSEALAALRRL